MMTLLLAGVSLLALLVWALWPAWVRSEARKVDERRRRLDRTLQACSESREWPPRAAGLKSEHRRIG